MSASPPTARSRRLNIEARLKPLEYAAMMFAARDDVLQRRKKFVLRNVEVGRPRSPLTRFVDERLSHIEDYRPDRHRQ
jgi:hypothetical protein